MVQNSQSNPLYWEDSYEIALRLMELYPAFDLETLGLERLNQMVVALPNFADDPSVVNDGILQEIFREWYEEYYG